jgi:hypothetical protein
LWFLSLYMCMTVELVYNLMVILSQPATPCGLFGGRLAGSASSNNGGRPAGSASGNGAAAWQTARAAAAAAAEGPRGADMACPGL